MESFEDAQQMTKRMSKAERGRQLLDVAWSMVSEKGTDALTLADLAEAAGVSKPIAYNHFGTRSGLLAALYHDFDAVQTAAMHKALAVNATSMTSAVDVVSAAYVDCAMTAGPRVSAIVAALAGSKDLEDVYAACRSRHHEEMRRAFAPFTALEGARGEAAVTAMLGAADALAQAAAEGRLTRDLAIEMLRVTMTGILRGLEKTDAGTP
jgi:AcrR family transcriptional regulator